MDNIELNNSTELEQLKAEYAILKNKFSQQEVINDRLLRDTMKQKVKGINNITLTSSLCGVFVILTSPFIFHMNPIINASWAFVAATVVLMLVCIYFNWEYNHRLNDTNIGCCDLKEFAGNVQYTRKKWHNWVRISIPLVIVWCGWLFTEIWLHSEDKKLAMFMIGGLVTGALIGGILGFKMNRKVVSNCDEILDQIDNIERMD